MIGESLKYITDVKRCSKPDECYNRINQRGKSGLSDKRQRALRYLSS